MANQFEVTVLTFFKQAYEADKAGVLGFIQSLEGGAEAFIEKALASYKPSGPLALIWPYLEPQAVALIKNELTAQASPESVYELVDKLFADALANAEK